MRLLPLEFTECLVDSPEFRSMLHTHEKELDATSQAIKGLIKEVKELLQAARAFSKAQRAVCSTLINFKFKCIESSQTDDEKIIGQALKNFGNLFSAIEDERDRMLDSAEANFTSRIESFQKEHIGRAKEKKKKFDKETAKYCQSLERHINLSTKKSENHLQEADACLDLEQRHFFQASLDYAALLQEVQERKKFEFVEILLTFTYVWLTFYAQVHDVAQDFRPSMTDLQVRLQRTRENFEATQDEAEQLKLKTLEKIQDPGSLNKRYTREGYLFLMEKKAIGTHWTKHYCTYQRDARYFTLMPYSQQIGKMAPKETLKVKECIRRNSDSIDKRFCIDIISDDKIGVYTLQAMSEKDRNIWLNAMDGKQMSYNTSGKLVKQEEYCLDETGFAFVQWCIHKVESEGLQNSGLYRIGGVTSKISRLTQMALDRSKGSQSSYEEEEWDIRTVTSALKNYFRNLPEPLLTYVLRDEFITAAKQEDRGMRVKCIKSLVHSLPKSNFCLLKMLICHLNNVSSYCKKNLMTVSNLGICFGPTLLRPEEETVAAIMDTKFSIIVVEILIHHYDEIFLQSVDEVDKPKRPSQPPPYVSPPYPGRRSVSQKDLSPQPQSGNNSLPSSPVHYPIMRHISSDGYSSSTRSMIAHPAFFPLQSVYNNASHSFFVSHHAPLHEQKSKPLIVYNPQWEDCQSTYTNNNNNNNNNRTSSRESLHSYTRPLNMSNSNYCQKEDPHEPSNGQDLEMYNYQCGDMKSVKARTLYACKGDSETELSFEKDEIIYNVESSDEDGWMVGWLNGKNGLFPANYAVIIP